MKSRNLLHSGFTIFEAIACVSIFSILVIGLYPILIAKFKQAEIDTSNFVNKDEFSSVLHRLSILEDALSRLRFRLFPYFEYGFTTSSIGSKIEINALGVEKDIDITNDPNMYWSSSNEDVATVSQGVVLLKGVGETIVKATLVENGLEYTLSTPVKVGCSITEACVSINKAAGNRPWDSYFINSPSIALYKALKLNIPTVGTDGAGSYLFSDSVKTVCDAYSKLGVAGKTDWVPISYPYQRLRSIISSNWQISSNYVFAYGSQNSSVYVPRTDSVFYNPDYSDFNNEFYASCTASSR